MHKIRKLSPRALDENSAPYPEYDIRESDPSMMHMIHYNSPYLPAWVHHVMYGFWLPPSLHLEKIRGLRNPLDVPTVNQKMHAGQWKMATRQR
eukprot:6465013-Amphidinium_carterae.1